MSPLRQEKVGTVVAVNRSGIVWELDYDDGVRARIVALSPPLPVTLCAIIGRQPSESVACAVHWPSKRRGDAIQSHHRQRRVAARSNRPQPSAQPAHAGHGW